MSLANQLRSRCISLLFSPGVRSLRRAAREGLRRVARRPHAVHVFLELDDPYSYLLSQYLPDLRARYAVDVHIHLTEALGDAYRPRADLLAVHAVQDCQRLAGELGVPFLDKGNAPPVERRRALIDVLAGSESGDMHGDEVLDALRLYWRGDSEGVARWVGNAVASGRGDAMLARQQALLARLGHYNAATVYYAGEWYWGIDRLHYLAERLSALGAQREDAANARLASLQQVTNISLPVSPPAAASSLPPLEFFFSFRSPYSYLAMQRVFDIADAFGLQLKLRPVLPMMMSGMRVPRPKLAYIGHDTVREAGYRQVPFGRFSDPLGKGIERCLAVFFYALAEKRAREFMLHAGEAVWARGIDVATDKGLRKVTARAGLFWPDVKAAIASDDWRAIVAGNRESMTESGCWGVPTLRLGDFVIWGQDRLWLLVRHIEEQCDTSGDGILV